MEKLNIILKKEYFNDGSYPYEVIRSCIIGYEKIQHIVVIIPGNPGIAEFYTEFMKELQLKLGNGYSVWCLTYGIFCHSDHKYDSPNLLNHEIEHKIRFFENHFPKNVKISLIGHSIGCYLSLTILNHFKKLENQEHITEISKTAENEENILSVRGSIYGEINKCYMIFPTIERIEESPNGQIASWLIKYLFPFIIASSSVFQFMPFFIKKIFFKIFVYIYDQHLIDVFVDQFGGKYCLNVINLAKYEFLQVVDADIESINNVKAKLKFYYSTRDGWVPLSYMKELVMQIPDVDYRTVNIPHIFMNKFNSEMVNILCKSIKI